MKLNGGKKIDDYFFCKFLHLPPTMFCAISSPIFEQFSKSWPLLKWNSLKMSKMSQIMKSDHY